MKTLSLKVPETLDRKLSARARTRRTTKSALIREALEDFLGSGSPLPKGSALELAGDLVGSLEGPGDLSTNKEYFKDFGR